MQAPSPLPSPPSSYPPPETGVPTLRVMRLQRPELHQAKTGRSLNGGGGGGSTQRWSNSNTTGLEEDSSDFALQNALCLPDSLTVHVGEIFTAYLGILNASSVAPIRRLTVAAQLQSPKMRWHLPSPLDPSSSSSSSSNNNNNNNTTAPSAAGIQVPPDGSVDTIVAHAMEEPGQHILRVEVSYLASEGGLKTFRKFYRFQVTLPVLVQTHVVRWSEAACGVRVTVQMDNAAGTESSTTAGEGGQPKLLIRSVEWIPAEGLAAVRLDQEPPTWPHSTSSSEHSPDDRQEMVPEKGSFSAQGDPSAQSSAVPRLLATSLWDKAGYMQMGTKRQYLFRVEADSHTAFLKGLAAGDPLGRVLVTWRKALGEQGQVSTAVVLCPALPAALVMSGGAGGTTPSAAASSPTQASGLSPRAASTAASSSALPSSTLVGGLWRSEVGTSTPEYEPGQEVVVHRSGWSVDVAAAAAQHRRPENNHNKLSWPPPSHSLASQWPVTVDPIDPPRRMTCQVPVTVQFLVVNHSWQARNLQCHWPLEGMLASGLVVDGPSTQSMGSVPPQGGSSILQVRLVALQAGLLCLPGCAVLDVVTGDSIRQPPLFHVFVDPPAASIISL